MSKELVNIKIKSTLNQEEQDIDAELLLFITASASGETDEEGNDGYDIEGGMMGEGPFDLLLHMAANVGAEAILATGETPQEIAFALEVFAEQMSELISSKIS